LHCKVCPVARTFETGRAETTQISREDGRVWDIRTFPIVDELGGIRNVIEIAREVTDKISLQAGALRTAHLASLGELAAGIAHEINNPVNGIINYAQILLDERGMSEEQIHIANRIVQEGERTAVIVSSLLSFAREIKSEKAPIHPHSLLIQTLGLLGRQLEKDSIILRLNVPHNLPAFVVDSRQIMQVFLNIISNARYALNLKYPGRDDKKILEILGEQTSVDSDSFVHMTFHDHGIGIPTEAINKVTDPFFSTKPRGRGTGLGLSISHGIVTEHEGRFFVESTFGKFTKVHLFLPMAEYNE
jgi:signal transduction histidine kinase